MKTIFPFVLLLILFVIAWFYYDGFFKGNKLPSTISTFKLKSEYLNRDVSIWVYLPPNYTSIQKPLPVIYMPDGQNIFHTSDDKSSWKVGETLDKIYKDYGQQFIAIGIGSVGDTRISELSPYSNKKYKGGKAESYLSFVREELLPKIEKDYFVSKERIDRAFIGSSLGGLTLFYAAFNCNDLFKNFGIFSPSFWFNPEVFELVKDEHLEPDTRLYFTMGDKEEEEHLELLKMDSLMSEHQSVDYHLKIIKGGKHNEAYWAKEFSASIEYLFQLKKGV